MAQQYDPVTWKNVAMPDNQTSLIKMAADRSNLLNDVINSFQSRDKQILDRNVSNLNAMEAYNTKEQSAKIIQALSGVANPSADGAKMLADTVSRLDPNMPVNKAELFNTGFNAIDKLAGQIKTNLGIRQTQNELDSNQGKIDASTESLIRMGILPVGTQPDPSHPALYAQQLQRMEQATRDTTASAAMMNARTNREQVNLEEKKFNRGSELADLNDREARVRVEKLEQQFKQDRSLASISNTFNSNGNIDHAAVKDFIDNGGDFSQLVKLGTEKYFEYNKGQQALVIQSNALNKVINDYQARSGAASAEEMDLFNDRKNAVHVNMTHDIQQVLLKNGYNSDSIKEATEQVLYLARGIVDHKNATEYNHNLFKPSGNEATNPEKVVRAAALEAAGLFVSQGVFNKQAKAANEEARAYAMSRLSGKNQ